MLGLNYGQAAFAPIFSITLQTARPHPFKLTLQRVHPLQQAHRQRQASRVKFEIVAQAPGRPGHQHGGGGELQAVVWLRRGSQRAAVDQRLQLGAVKTLHFGQVDQSAAAGLVEPYRFKHCAFHLHPFRGKWARGSNSET